MGCAQSVHDAQATAGSSAEPARSPQPAPLKIRPPDRNEADEQALMAVHAHKAPPPGGRPPAPGDEGRRIQALHALHALEQPELDARLEPVVELMRATFQVDYAALTLINSDRQVYKTKAGGWPLDAVDRRFAFGSWALASEHAQMLVVENALEDRRFRDNPLVTCPRTALRFYAGAPLLSADGAGAYGMLFIADCAPRRFAAEQLAILTNFAELCARKLEGAVADRVKELRAKAAAAEAGMGQKLVRDLSTMTEAVLMVDCATDAWLLRWANSHFMALTGLDLEGAIGVDIWSLLQLAGEEPEEAMVEANACIFCRQPFSLAVMLAAGGAAHSGTAAPRQLLMLHLRPAALGLRGSGIPAVGIPADVASFAAEAEGMREQLGADLRDVWFATLAPESAAAPTAAQPVSPLGPGAASPSESASPVGACGALSPGGAPASPGMGAMRSLSYTVDERTNQQVFKDATLGPLLGAGSYGRVYRGRWRGAEVAVKVMEFYAPINGAGFELPGEKHSALLEALLGKNFARHPNLVQTYALGVRPTDAFDPAAPPGTPVRHTLWVVLQLCNRGSLHEAILKGRFRSSFAADSEPSMLAILLTAQEIAGGLSLLHDAGIIHGDLSGNNVLLNAAANYRRFTAAVSDFGLARMCADSGGKHTETVGTVTHQPPELLREGLLTPAADVWAFGVLLWSMYTGEQPYSGEQPFLVISRVAAGPRCPLELPPSAPARFSDLFERCVSYDRLARPSFRQILELLAPLIKEAEAEAPPPLPSPTRAGLRQLHCPSFRSGEPSPAAAEGGGAADPELRPVLSV